MPSVKQKADWALRWIADQESTFGSYPYKIRKIFNINALCLTFNTAHSLQCEIFQSLKFHFYLCFILVLSYINCLHVLMFSINRNYDEISWVPLHYISPTFDTFNAEHMWM